MSALFSRWAIGAAHCFISLGLEKDGRRAQFVTHRDGTPYKETIEIRRVYLHPGYKYPQPYNDIAVLELGRRIAFDFEKYGSTPVCLGKESDHARDMVSITGYGKTENGEKGIALLSSNMTIISNDECRDFLDLPEEPSQEKREKIRKSLCQKYPRGIDDQYFCAKGIRYKKGFSAICEGDKGGPLTLLNDEQKTLIGITQGMITGL